MNNTTDTNQPDHFVHVHDMVINTNQASEERESDVPISDKEAWLRIFEVIRPTVRNTNIAISSTNYAFGALKNKLEAEL